MAPTPPEPAPAPAGYAVRRQRVSMGAAGQEVLVAVFPLRGGGAACLQLQDEGELRQGGVYLLERDAADCPGLAPRFDELFAAAAALVRLPGLREELPALLQEAARVARLTRPRLEPPALAALGQLQEQAADLDRRHPSPGPFSLEELLLASLLIFVSEEERYPRPRYRGCDVALERFAAALGAPG